tara:strand:- start:266 stop:634 length:369 start_codon:yes stop_codon:yes gene_type:complete
MPYKKDGHKSTAMDSFSAPRAEGLIPQVLNNFGFAQSEGGRFPAGLKYDFVKAVANVTATAEADEIVQMIGSETARLQDLRKTATVRVTIPDTPDGLVKLVSSGKMSLDALKQAIAKMESEK